MRGSALPVPACPVLSGGMTDVDPHLQEVIVRLVRALESMDRRYCLIGALVPRLLMLVPAAEYEARDYEQAAVA